MSPELQKLEAQGINGRIDASERVSPVVLVRKKNESTRMCVDLRGCGKALIADSFPLLQTKDPLYSLRIDQRLLKLDLAYLSQSSGNSDLDYFP